MPIDPNIALSVKPVQIANPLEQYMQVQQIQQVQNQSRLADLMYGEKQREVADTAQMNDQYKKAIGADGSIDRTKLYGGLAAAGLGSRLPSIQKQFADADKAAADVSHVKAQTKKAETEAAGMNADQREKKRQQAITDIAGFDNAEQALASLAAHEKAGDLTQEAAASVRATIPVNPANFAKWQVGMLRQIMSAGEGMKYLTPDANTVATSATSRANNAATNATSRANNRDTIAAAKENQKAQYDAARGVLVDTRTGTATAVMGPDGKPLTRDKAMTEFQGKSAGFADRAQEADAILNSLAGKYRPAAINSKQSVQEWPLVGGMLGAATNKALSPNDQQAEQAQRNFVNSILRQESGAAIGVGEFENAKQQYFPQPGDSPQVIAQKAANRRTAIAGLARSAGGNYTPPAATAAPSNNGLPSGWSVEVH